MIKNGHNIRGFFHFMNNGHSRKFYRGAVWRGTDATRGSIPDTRINIYIESGEFSWNRKKKKESASGQRLHFFKMVFSSSECAKVVEYSRNILVKIMSINRKFTV